MVKESCVTYPPNSVYLQVRAPLIAICDKAPDPHAAAVILNQFIYWTDSKIEASHQARYHNEAAKSEGLPEPIDASLWIYKDYDELKTDLLNLFGRNKVVENLQWLVTAGYLQRRHNPRYKWDKTWQYALNIEVVQTRIGDTPTVNFKPSVVLKQTHRQVKNKRAIPEKENTSKEQKDIAPCVAGAADNGSKSSNPQPTPKNENYKRLFSGVALLCYGIDFTKLGERKLSKSTEQRIGKLASMLNECGATPEQLWAFKKWYTAKFSGAAIPRDFGKFEAHWVVFTPTYQPGNNGTGYTFDSKQLPTEADYQVNPDNSQYYQSKKSKE